MSTAVPGLPQPGVLDKILEHLTGSKHYYDLGCHCSECRTAASDAKTLLRRKRRTQRIFVAGVLIHPALHPVDSTEPARHGTPYGRREFGCNCRPCKTAYRTERTL